MPHPIDIVARLAIDADVQRAGACQLDMLTAVRATLEVNVWARPNRDTSHNEGLDITMIVSCSFILFSA